ncbi:MAG: glycosyltransferase, partial [Pseudomonadota bacterium]
MSPSLDSLVMLPPDAVEALHRAIPSASGRPARISYLVGPGDPFSTYEYWKKGEFDPRVPSIAYSTMFYELVSALGANGQIVQRGPQSRPPFIDGEFRFDTVRLPRGEGFFGYHAARFQYARACLAAIKDYGPDIAVVASDFDWQYLPLVKNRCRRTVLSLHNTIWPMGTRQFGTRQKAANAAISFWLRSVDSSVCTSHECERQLKHLSGNRIATFVAAPQQVSRPEAPPLKNRPSRLIYLGRIETAKGVFDLLETFADLRDRHPALTLVFAGGGGALEMLKQQIDAMG